jgi:hypothetical protein
MVDIHSMAASSRPSHHEREVERGATSRPRAGRPRRAGGRSGATTVMVEGQPQRTAGAVPAPSVVAGVDATLLVACQLLNNPPSRTTSTFGAPGRGAWCFSGSKASTTPSRHPRDDVAASRPEARGGCCSATASPSPRSHVGSLPQASSCSGSCSTAME